MKFTFVHNNINVLDLYFISDPDGYWIEIMPVRDRT